MSDPIPPSPPLTEEEYLAQRRTGTPPVDIGRYRPIPTFDIHGKLRQWAVEDGSILKGELVRDYRKKNRVTWYGTYLAAYHLSYLLNKNRDILGKKAGITELDQTSKTQRIHHANNKRKKTKPKPAFKSPFHTCDTCGKMVRDDHEC